MTAVLAVLVVRQVTGINGPSYWRWPWREQRGLTPYVVLLLAATPLLIAQLRFAPPRAGALPAIALMMGTTLATEVAVRGMDSSPFGFTRVIAIIEEPGATGYFTHAEEFVRSGEPIREFLRRYANRMAGFSLHARNKPPGAILFYVPFIRGTLTEDAAALSAGFAIGLLATLSVPATYLLIRELTGDRAAAFHGASFMSLCPGLVLFLPEYDQFYPVYSCALATLWAKGLTTGRGWYALAFGLVFSLACFQTFNLLVLGLFVIGYAGMVLVRSRGGSVSLILRQASLVIAVTASVYGVLFLWSGYNPLRTILTAVANHDQDMPATHRAWPRTVPFDLLDFALGTGWVSVPVVVYFLMDRWRFRSWKANGVQMSLLCLGQIGAVALLGVLQGETARVWIFMFPLLMVPIGLALAQGVKRTRLTILGCLWLLTAVLAQNMVFV